MLSSVGSFIVGMKCLSVLRRTDWDLRARLRGSRMMCPCPLWALPLPSLAVYVPRLVKVIIRSPPLRANEATRRRGYPSPFPFVNVWNSSGSIRVDFPLSLGHILLFWSWASSGENGGIFYRRHSVIAQKSNRLGHFSHFRVVSRVRVEAQPASISLLTSIRSYPKACASCLSGLP